MDSKTYPRERGRESWGVSHLPEGVKPLKQARPPGLRLCLTGSASSGFRFTHSYFLLGEAGVVRGEGTLRHPAYPQDASAPTTHSAPDPRITARHSAPSNQTHQLHTPASSRSTFLLRILSIPHPFQLTQSKWLPAVSRPRAPESTGADPSPSASAASTPS